MGAGNSKQRLGERVLNARKKLAADLKLLTTRTTQLQKASPESLDAITQSIPHSLSTYTPFSDSVLLVAFDANPVHDAIRMARRFRHLNSDSTHHSVSISLIHHVVGEGASHSMRVPDNLSHLRVVVIRRFTFSAMPRNIAICIELSHVFCVDILYT